MGNESRRGKMRTIWRGNKDQIPDSVCERICSISLYYLFSKVLEDLQYLGNSKVDSNVSYLIFFKSSIV